MLAIGFQDEQGLDFLFEGGGANSGDMYTLSMYDSYGDGWNEALLEILVDGQSVGVFGGDFRNDKQLDVQFQAPDGLWTTVWTPGAFDSEITFAIFDKNG